MKKIAIVFLIFISGCTKCGTCTRTWSYTSYQVNQNGTHLYPKQWEGDKETFDVCGSDQIKNEEKTVYIHSEIEISNSITLITDGKGECGCDTH